MICINCVSGVTYWIFQTIYIYIYIYIYISPDEWATTKQACSDEPVVYLSFSSHDMYIALLLCIEHCFT